MSLLSESFREEFDAQLNKLRRITNHGPSIGRFIEFLLISLLKKYLPSSVEYTSGFIKGINIDVSASSQIDIICYDRQNFPILFDIGEFKVIPAKAVKGLIEIKSTLSKSNLIEALNTSCKAELCEVPLSSKMYFLSTNSKLSPEKAFSLIKDFYIQRPKISKFFSAFYSLNWNQIIICHTSISEHSVHAQLIRLSMPRSNDIAIFIMQLIVDLYEKDTFGSVNNHLGPSIFIPLEVYEFDLHRSQSKL